MITEKRLRLYTVFHLNMAYSSIEEEQRPEVVQRCYWPLLRLIRKHRLPLGIEASGYTLEAIAAIDPAWLDELRRLTSEGICEFIGSGYAQVIGPLVPADINAANLRLGHQVYERLLGFRPPIGLVNEQAYSAGLLQHYLDADYRAIIMEWDNPASCHPQWESAWRYLPQFALGQRGEEIPVIWSNSIAFQKFQRYAHGEIELDEYMSYLREHLGETPRAFSLYSNDVEVFDFRPGRYHTEAAIQQQSEWYRIERLFEALLGDGGFQFIPPSQVLDLLHEHGAGNKLSLESPKQPILVKKQGKYNITRWAVTGRDSLGINTACWRIYAALKKGHDVSEADWHELCYLWGSDFRTHTTKARWQRYLERLAAFEKRSDTVARAAIPDGLQTVGDAQEPDGAKRSVIERQGHWLTAETASSRVRLNCRRGLAIDSLWLGSLEGPSLCGTLPHGYYQDITMGADWYTGHAVLEPPGQPKVTDLNPVEPEAHTLKTGDILIEGAVTTAFGQVLKRLQVCATEPKLKLSYSFEWETMPVGSFRLVNLTLNPEAFDRTTLHYRTHNGGRYPEMFPLHGLLVEHGDPVSFLVSANSGIGITEGWVEIGDARRSLRVEVDKAAAALIGFVSYREIGGSFFCRLALSAGEVDDTRRTPLPAFRREIRCEIRLATT